MRMFFNHGLSASELYTNTPKKVIDRKWRWFTARYGTSNSYEDAIADPFKYCLGIVFHKVINEKLRFKIPYVKDSYIDFEVVTDEDFENQRRKGRFQNIDFIESDFTGYGIRYHYHGKHYKLFRPIYVGGDLKRNFVEGINSGVKYYAIKDFFLPDILPQIQEKFSELTLSEIKKLLAHGFRRMHFAIRSSCFITINTTKYLNCYVYIGTIALDPVKQIQAYSAVRDKKLRIIEKWKRLDFDGYYYIGLTPERCKEWAETNKNARTLANFSNIMVRKIKEELYYKNKELFIFRIKLKKFKGWLFWANKLITRELEYMGKVDSLKFTPATKTWKEIIKEYETK